ncbi:MAG: GLUG motif-containing protein [Oscillospiraceae bacterium]
MDKTRMGKRVASLLLSLVMMLSLLPTAAYATMADGVETQGAIVSENGTGVSDDSNSSGNTDDLQVGGSKDSGTADDTTGAEGGADPTDSVNGNDSADPQDDGDAVLPVASSVVSTSEELVAAIAAANDGDTITLGEGEFTTYGNTSPKKSLTFVGAGTGTVWTIGNLSKDVKGEGNGDCSFDDCETITFKNMTLKVDNKNYRGFIRINHTVVENCTLEGRTAYWGYETAKFVGSTFTAPEGDYALWDYSTKDMSFDGCKFNISGKGVHVYVEAGNAGEATRTVEVNNCTVESTKESKAFLNIKNSTQSYDVTLSGTNTVNGLTADGTTGSALYQVETTEVTETTGNPVTVKQANTAGELETVYEVKQPSANVAKVGDTEYATLDKAIAALSSSSYTLQLLDKSAWNEATPVYWAAGSESGYAATLADALTAAYKANGDITIVCRPGADVGKLTHGHVADDITIYGNNAYISSGECELEVDTYMFSRDTGKQVTTGGAYLDKDITVTAYELDNLGVWGQRHTDHKVTVNLTDCDSVNGITVQRVYISGTTGVNDITLTGCDFATKATSVYSNADGAVVIDNCSFTGAQVPVNFNHKANGKQTVTVQNSTFTKCGDNGDWKQFAAPVRFVNSGSGTMDTTVGTCTFTGTVGSNGDILLGDGRVGEKSNDVKLTVENTAANVQAQQPGYYAKNGTTDESKQGTKTVAAGDKLTTSVTQLTTSSETTYVAEVKGVKYETLQAAIDKAGRNAIVTLLADTRENVTIDKMITLDLNGHTLNGGQVKAKPALTVTARVTVKDGSAAQTGTIKREDTAENSGVSSHYVIDVQGAGWLTFESGSVTNNSGNDSGKGASLVRVGDDSVDKYPGLNIKGGTFTQDNFIVIKVDSGDLFLNGGTLNSANSYAIEDWHRATIKGGTVNGTVAVWTYNGGHNSDLTISGGTVNGNVASVSYDKAEGKLAKVSISGGTVNGTLGTYTYGNGLIPIDDAAKATIEVTGGTFSEAPTKYVVEDSAITPNADGTYGVAKAYLAKVGDTSYYTMDEAFKAQTASGKAIVLLRDYTTGSTFNSGSIARTVDLNGHTWTCTGTDANSAAFEINYPDASLTVKNGKVVSSQLVGLIPSAMGGTIKYDNSSLVFEGVEMTTTAHSGIETNGNNTNDTVTLRNSTLNVPNGFGIYFPSSGTLTIDNSVINAKTMGVQVCAGSLNITGTDTAITVSGDGIDKTINDGAIEDGAAISIVNRAGYKGLDEIKVEGGKFTAKGDNAAVKAYKWENQTASAFDNSKNVVAISGGTFSSEVDKSLCAEGFIPTQNADGTYGVKEGADGYVEDENGNVTISTAEGLFYFAKKANAGNNFAGKTVKLANDIDLNNEKWTPIGSFNDATTQFKGTFDGQNHAVTGLKVEESNKQGVGFFGKVYTGTIKNLTVEGSVSASNCNYVGGIVGHGYATITNCTFKGTVGNNNSMQVGGIAGSGGFTVTNCSVYADVTAECWAGGIVGNCQDGGAYTNCYVEGIISSKSTFWGGGAAGITPVPLYPSQVISGCYSNTVVKVAGEEVNCPIIACYNNPLDHDGYSGGLKIYDNSWNKQKNSNDSYPIYAEKDGKGGVLMEGMTAARDNSLIMLEDDLNYVTGDLSKVRIMAGSSVTQAQIDALAVASVGDSKYKSLTEAIGAAQDGQTVTLLADAAEDVVISKSITLDLGGKTLTNTNVGKATISVQSGTVTVKNGNVVGGNDYYNIEAKKDANLTLTDVTATAGNTGSSMIDNWGTLTITSGTYTGGLNVVKSEEGSVLNISGGTFTLDYAPSSGYTAVILVYGDTTISGGEFIQTATPKWGYPQVVMTGVVEGYTAITRVTGGHFVNKKSGDNIFHGLGKATSDNFKVSGGTFNKSIPESYCADGFIPTKNADGTYGVKEGQYVAQIGSKKYETLADAIRLAAKGKTITLLCDVADCGSLTISKNITLDGGGHTISGNSSISVNMPGNAAADVTIRNVNFKDIANGNKLSAFYFSQVKGKLTITGCTFDSIEYEAIQVTPMEGAEVNVSNNVFKAKADGTQVRHIHIEMAYGSGFDCEGQNIKLTVTDNQLHGAVSGDASMGIWWVGTDSTLKVDGNYMEHPETVSITLANSGVHYNRGDLIYPARSQADVDVDDLMPAVIVAEKASGESKIKAYSTLAEAINAAQAGQTVRLLADVEQNAQLAIDKSITLDLNGKTIKISGYTAEKAQVSVKGNLTIQDSSEAQTGKICSDYTGTAGRVVSVENGGKLTIAGGTITTEGMSGLSGSAVYIASGAEVNMTGGAVKVDAKRGNVAMNVKGSTGVFTMSGGSVIAEAGDGTETYITAISGSSGSTIQISAGTVSGPQALFARSSATTITGGSFTGSITVKNGSISGGTFDRALDKKACAAGYVPTQNEDGTYGVAVGKFTVMVTSRTTGSDSPVANVAGGGSNITYAQGTKVTASAISGYKFVGWFVNEYTGTPYSTDLSCEVKPTADCTMIAVYEPISGGKFWLTVTASEFTVNGGAVQDSYLYEQFAVGASVTVNFTGSENFLYWVNASNKVVSTSKTYTFSMGSATTLKAVYAEKEEHQAMVVFISHTQQVISSKGYTDTQEIQFPEPPIKMGATFVRWSMTEAEIRAAMATTTTGIIVVEPVYEFSAGSYTVTVNYPNDDTATYTATVGKITTVTAKSIDGKVFKCWKNGDTVLGYTETLKIAPRGDLILTAEYVDAGTTVDRLPVIALTEISASQQGAKYAVSFTATRSVPDGYTVTEQGVLVSTDSRYGEAGALDAMKLDADGDEPDNTKSLKATNTDATGVTVLNGIVSAADRTVYGRAYMILRDSSGAMVYVYSDTILSGSYNSLTTNGGN